MPRRALVWPLLNDTAALQACIDGCEKLERVAPERIDAVLKVRLGWGHLRFYGSLVLSDIKPPFSYTIAGEGRGALSGLATGRTQVRLEETGWNARPAEKRQEIAKKGKKAARPPVAGQEQERRTATRLVYHMHGTAGGKLTQLGSKMLSGAANKTAARFFAKLAAACEAEAARQWHEGEDL